MRTINLATSMLLGLLAIWLTESAMAQTLFVPPAASAPPATQQSPAPDATEAADRQQARQRLVRLINELAREHIPHHYEDTSKWGGTAQRWDGLHVHREGLQIKTKRRYKEVNHGVWTLYRIDLIDPESDFRIGVENERELGGGVVGFDLVFTAHLKAFARRARWSKGVQLFSLSVDSEAWVELRLKCELSAHFDLRVLPPDVVFAPRVTDAKLNLTAFDVHRISDVSGSVAHELGKGVEAVLRRKIDEKSDQLVAKINARIDKHKDDLRLPLHDLAASQWSKLTHYIQPDKEATGE
ncbi:MAG: hypothetical protein RIC55_10945 [Pirellulaceae bacterium]